MLSQPCKYGLRSLVLMASQRDKEMFKISEIAEELNIPKYYLTKIMQRLTDEGFLTSYKGPNGGIKFQRNPEDISFDDIITLYDGNNYLKDCFLGFPGYNKFETCPLGIQWQKKKNELLESLRTNNLMTVVNELQTESEILKLIK